LSDLRLTETLSEQERECLILEHLPQVHLLARKIHGRLPETVSLDDLISIGVVGLISAIDRFDPSRRIQLRTYAEHKIKGGILDSLRRLDWAPRRRRKQAKQIESAFAAAEQRWKRAPTDEEVAAELNLTVDVYRQRRAQLRLLIVERLDSPGSGISTAEGLRADERECPSAVFERDELTRALSAAISGLPEIHQTVLTLYYRDELRPRAISKIVGLHESRVFRIRSQAIHRLRACMAKLWPAGAHRHRPVDTS